MGKSQVNLRQSVWRQRRQQRLWGSRRPPWGGANQGEWQARATPWTRSEAPSLVAAGAEVIHQADWKTLPCSSPLPIRLPSQKRPHDPTSCEVTQNTPPPHSPPRQGGGETDQRG